MAKQSSVNVGVWTIFVVHKVWTSFGQLTRWKRFFREPLIWNHLFPPHRSSDLGEDSLAPFTQPDGRLPGWHDADGSAEGGWWDFRGLSLLRLGHVPGLPGKCCGFFGSPFFDRFLSSWTAHVLGLDHFGRKQKFRRGLPSPFRSLEHLPKSKW